MSISLPLNFTDNNPERGPWHHPTAERPSVFIYVEVLYADGIPGKAVWTGNLWWCKEVVEPIAWRPMPEVGNRV